MSNRKSQGVTLAFIAFCALVVVIIGAAFFIISMMIGGNSELRNATDSGNLNVALQALGKPVYLKSISDSTGLAAMQFAGLGSNSSYTNPEIDLNTFNRASAVALMVAANAQAMGNGNSQAQANAQNVVAAWQNVSTALAAVLSKQGNFDTDFGNLAGGNSVRMLNGSAAPNTNTLGTQNSFAYAFTEMGQGTSDTVGGANVYFTNGQISNLSSNSYIMTAPTSTGLPSNNGSNILFPQGYVPFTYNTSSIFFVPLKDTGNKWQYFNNSQPHLINGLVFNQFTNTPSTWTSAVPNSFKSGSVTNESLQNSLISGTVGTIGGNAPNLTMQTTSSAVAFSLATFQAQMPLGYIIIRNDMGPCNQSISVNSYEDIYGFLMGNNLTGVLDSTGTPYFDDGGNGGAPTTLNQIIIDNTTNNGQAMSDCASLTPHLTDPATCTGITSLSNNNIIGPITNLNLDSQYSKYASSITADYPQQISTSAGFVGAGNGQCINALGLANQSLLSQRTLVLGATSTADLANNQPYRSGAGAVKVPRGPLTNCGSGSNSSIVQDYGNGVSMNNIVTGALAQVILQRCYQMDPGFNGILADTTQGGTIQGWNTPIPMGGVAYLYFNGSVNPTTGAISGGLIVSPNPPPWLNSGYWQANNIVPLINSRLASVDGYGFPNYGYGADGNIQYFGLQSYSVNYDVDVDNDNGDCGYSHPFDKEPPGLPPMCLNQGLEYKPGSGYQGLLGEISLIACFGQNNCGPITGGAWQYSTSSYGANLFNACTFSNGQFGGPC